MNPLRIAEQFRTAVEREGFPTREPFVSLALPYQGAPALAEPRETRDSILNPGFRGREIGD
jgi:hypothetical protein